MTAHSRRWFADSINDRFDRADGLGAARLRRRFTSTMRSTSPLNVWPIRSTMPTSMSYAVALGALRRPQATQSQPTPARVPIQSP